MNWLEILKNKQTEEPVEEKEEAVETKHGAEDVKAEKGKEKKGMKFTGENKDGREGGSSCQRQRH